MRPEIKLNIYGLKQGRFKGYEKIKNLIVDREFNPSAIDLYLYIRNGMVLLTYIDDCILVVTSIVDIDAFIQSMKNGSDEFVLTDEGDIKQFLGI